MNTNDISISLPASKSLSLRWLIVNHVVDDCFILNNLSTADDSVLLQRLLRDMKKGSTAFFCYNAGAVARFLIPILALCDGSYIVDGDDRLRKRPMSPLVDALNSIGLHISYLVEKGFLPVQIDGAQPTRKMISVNMGQSSQFASSLLMVGASIPTGLSVSMVGRISSRPYLDMTAQVLRQAGVEVSVSPNGHIYSVSAAPSHLPHKRITIEPDWTAASYFYTMAALCPNVRLRLRNLGYESAQGDSVVDSIFSHLGVKSQQLRSPYRKAVRSITIIGTGTPDKRFSHSFLQCPDLFPTVAVACAALGVDAHLRGIRNLRIKESDRIEATMSNLQAMGCEIELQEDVMHIFPSALHAVDTIRTFDDHRIAMAFAPLQLLFPSMQFDNPNVVSKSFPMFWDEFGKVKAGIVKK